VTAFSAIVRERMLPPASENEYRFEVVVMIDDEPVLLCRHRLELRDDWHRRDRDFNVWKTVEPPAVWIEKCKTLQDAKRVAARRSVVLNKLADLFDADTAVSLYRSWDSYT
jgi:hypothetical protein